MRILDPELREYEDDRVYADKDGDLWFRTGDVWAYLTDTDGTLTDWDTHADLPTAFGPFAELSAGASAVLRKTYVKN